MIIVRNKTPLQWGELACDTLMSKFDAKDLPPAGRFHYHQGVFLLGMEQCLKQNKKDKYFNYIKNWVNSIISVDGTITKYDPGQLDDIQPGILLYSLYEKQAMSVIKMHYSLWFHFSISGELIQKVVFGTKLIFLIKCG